MIEEELATRGVGRQKNRSAQLLEVNLRESFWNRRNWVQVLVMSERVGQRRYPTWSSAASMHRQKRCSLEQTRRSRTHPRI